MNLLLPEGQVLAQTSYNLDLVALSYAIAVLGSFVALTAARNIRGPNGLQWRNVLASGAALGGIGVWSMHFTGMLALKLGMGSSYSVLETLVSLVAAMGATSAALACVALRPNSLARVLGAGTLLGLAVCAMHYTGMAAADFICTAPESTRFATPTGSGMINAMQLAALTPMVAIAMAVVIGLEQVLRKNLTQSA